MSSFDHPLATATAGGAVVGGYNPKGSDRPLTPPFDRRLTAV